MENQDVEIMNTFSELTEIFKYLEKNILEKIPKDLRISIYTNKNPNYNFIYDKTKTLDEQNINEKTKDLLSVLYLTYCCDNNTRDKIMEICKQNEFTYEQQLKEKYSTANIFKNNPQNDIKHHNEMMALIEKKQDSFLTKLIRKIKNFFNWR